MSDNRSHYVPFIIVIILGGFLSFTGFNAFEKGERRKSGLQKGLQHYAEIFNVAQRKWIVIGVPSEQVTSSLEKKYSWFILVAGLFLTGLISVYLKNIIERRERIEGLLTQRTQQLLKVKDKLEESEAKRKNTEEQLIEKQKNFRKINKELDDFAYIVSHDLRAPVRGIASFAGFLEEDYSDKLDDEGREYLTDIRKGVLRLDTLINDLLALSRISRIKNPFEDVPIKELINSILERIGFDIKEHNVELVIEKNMSTIRCDRIKLGEVFLNLINNAIKFSSKNNKENPKIHIGYEDDDKYHKFYVKDNGIGIAPEFHEKIFDIFQRLHAQSEYEGTGAGLSIVKRVIDDHCGEVWIESQLGQGACFYFTVLKDLKEEST